MSKLSRVLGGKKKKVKASEGERMLADIAQQRHEAWKKSYVPIENAYIDRVLGFNTLATRDALTGQGVTSVEQQLTSPYASPRGYAPGSGRGINEQVMAALARGKARATGAVETGNAVDARALSGKTGLIRYGQGLSEQGTTAIGRAGVLANANAATKLQMDSQIRDARDEAIGSVVGMGAGYALGRPPGSPNAETARQYAQNSADYYERNGYEY